VLNKTYRFALKSALFSAILGILLTVLFLITEHDSILIIGFIHLFPTVIIQFIIFLVVLHTILFNEKETAYGLQVLFLILLNIPLAFICGFITLNMLY